MRPSPHVALRLSASPRFRGGFTLTELLVVILIVVLLSAAVLPAILPALNSRRVSEGSRILQSEIARARDAAVRGNRPTGFRLIPDPIDPSRPNVLTCSRLMPLDFAPDFNDGVPHAYFDPPPYPTPNPLVLQYYPPPAGLPPYSNGATPVFATNPGNPGLLAYPYLVVRQDKADSNLLPNSPTCWFFSIRQGDQFQYGDSGAVYTIAGPIVDPTIAVTPYSDVSTPGSPLTNPDRLINYGPGYLPTIAPGNFEFLYLMNGNDDDGDGFVDEGFDGVDNDGDGIIDPGFNGKDDDGNGYIDDPQELYLHNSGTAASPAFIYPGNPFGLPDGGYSAYLPSPPALPLTKNKALPNEYEEEVFTRPRTRPAGSAPRYTITRRPVASTSSRAIELPTNVVIDMTTWNTHQPERSRLPVDPATGAVDVIVAPNGQILAAGTSANLSPPVYLPFYHFWLCERDDVAEPTVPTTAKPYRLPMPPNTGNDPRIASVTVSPSTNVPTLRGERRLLSINTRTGAIIPTAVETFYLNNPSYPYEAAEAGVKDVQP